MCVIGIYIHKFTSDKAREIEHCTKITIIEELIFSRANDSISWSYAPLQSTKCTVSHLLRVGCRREDMGVVSVYTSFHVWHTSIADFHIVSVENFVEFVGFRKVLVGKI